MQKCISKSPDWNPAGTRSGRYARQAVTPILLMMIVMVGNGIPTYAATIQVDDRVNKQVATLSWGTGGLPAQPNYEWRFASSDGLDYDSLGTTGYRNYGQTALVTGLTDENRPSLTEGILQPNMAGVSLNGSTNRLRINDAMALRPASNDFGIDIWIRYTQTVINDGAEIFSRTSAGIGHWEWAIGVGNQGVGAPVTSSSIWVMLSQSGTAAGKLYFTGSYGDGKWHHVAFTWIGNTLAVYVNGSAVSPTKITDTAIDTIYAGNSIVRIGNGAYGSVYFAGDICGARYWQGAEVPDAAEVLALYNAQKPLGTSASPYPSLQSAVDQAVVGDTILVNPGRYQETVTISKAFDYVGRDPITSTGYSLPEFFGTNLPAAAGTVGFTVSADNEVGFLAIRGYTTAQGVLASATSDGSLFHHLEIDSCLNGVDFDGAASGDSLVNTVVDGAFISNATGFRATTSSAVTVAVINNIFINTKTALTKAAAQTLTETNNCFYLNNVNYAGTLDPSDIIAYPLFRSDGDYVLSWVSPIFNTGRVIREGNAPFGYLQQAPEPGVWETLKSQNAAVSRMIWGRKGPWASGGGGL